jgi:hypothetical protein
VRFANHGTGAHILPPAKAEAASRAFSMLGNDAPPERLIEAVESSLACQKAEAASVTFTEACGTYVAARSHRTKNHVSEIRSLAQKFNGIAAKLRIGSWTGSRMRKSSRFLKECRRSGAWPTRLQKAGPASRSKTGSSSSLQAESNGAELTEARPQVDLFKERIAAANKAETADICREIREAQMDLWEREELAKVVKGSLQIPIADARNMLKPPRQVVEWSGERPFDCLGQAAGVTYFFTRHTREVFEISRGTQSTHLLRLTPLR